MGKMALYIVGSVLFGYGMGVLYAKAKNREFNLEKEQKHTKVLSEKNSTIMNLKSELRSSHRKVDAINQGYELQSKLLSTKEKELNQLKREYKTLSMQVTEKISTIDNKDEIINLLEKKIQELSKERA